MGAPRPAPLLASSRDMRCASLATVPSWKPMADSSDDSARSTVVSNGDGTAMLPLVEECTVSMELSVCRDSSACAGARVLVIYSQIVRRG